MVVFSLQRIISDLNFQKSSKRVILSYSHVLKVVYKIQHAVLLRKL